MAFIDLIETPIVHRSYPIQFDKVKTDESNAVSEILSTVDPRTRLAVDMISVFRSKETSPEVRSFIEQNFLVEQNQETLPSGLDISDDDIIDTTPNRYDTLNELEERLAKRLEDEKNARKVKRSKAKLRASFEKVGLDTSYFDKL